MSIIYRSDRAMTNPPLNAPLAPGRASFRATFSAGDNDDVVGTETAIDPGLDVARWEGDAGAFRVRSGAVVRTPSGPAGFIGLPILGADGVHMTWTVRTRPTSGVIYMDIMRPLGLGASAYRVLVTGTFVRLVKRVSSGSTDLSPNTSIDDGARVGIRWVGGLLSLLVNDTPKAHVRDSELALAGYAGISTASSDGFEMDNAEIDVY